MKNILIIFYIFFSFFKLQAEEKILVEASRPVNSSGPTFSTADHEVFSVKNFRNSHQVFLKDFMKQKTSLQVVTAGPAGGQTSVFLQGLKSEHLLVLIDGVKMNDAASPARGYDFSNLTLDQIEKIEIIKGPQSVLYGGDALAGVIKITTKGHSKNLILKDSANFKMGAGSFGQSQASVSSVTAFPKGHLSLGIDGQSSHGFSAASNEYAGNKEADGFKRGAAKAQIFLKPGHADRLQSGFQFQSMQTDLDKGGGANQDDLNYELKQNNSMLFLNYDHEFSDNVSLELKISQNNQRKKADNPKDSALDTNFLLEDYQGTFKKLSLGVPVIFVHENVVHKLSLSVAKDMEEMNFSSVSGYGNSSIQGKHESIASGYAQYGFLSGPWNFTLGGRSDRHTRFGVFRSEEAMISHKNAPTGLEFWLKEGSAFKAPSLYQLYSSFGSLTLAPERAQSYQLGMRDGVDNYSFEILFFKNKIDQLIDYDYSSNKYKNFGILNSHGVELQLTQNLEDGKYYSATYVYTRSLDQNRKESLRRPRHGGKGRVGKKIDLWELELGFLYVGKRPDIDAISFERVSMPSYMIFQFNLDYIWKNNYHVGFLLDNILDKRYQEIQGQGTAGRNFQVMGSYDF